MTSSWSDPMPDVPHGSVSTRRGGTARVLRMAQLFAAPVLYLGPIPADAAYAQASDALAVVGPGAEHALLAELTGTWCAKVTTAGITRTVPASARTILGGRFLEIDVTGADSAFSTAARLLLGFDRRHGVYQAALHDTWGTYFVTARGSAEAPTTLTGSDDDPVMRQMGLTKEFVITLREMNARRLVIDIAFVDTRTAARKLIPAGGWSFERSQ
jgi:hypothetical protein